MTTITTEAHQRAVLEAALTVAWLQRCGPEGKAGKWTIPGGYLPVLEGFGQEHEVEVYPIYAALDEDGAPRAWSAHLDPKGPGVVEAWDWRINVGWDELSSDEADEMEDLGGCMGDHDTTFLALGNHQERPAIPDGIVHALVKLSEVGAGGDTTDAG